MAQAIPASTRVAPAAGPAKATTHVVRAGDTLSQIAVRHGLRITQLRDWNGLGKDEPLRIDGMLRLTAPESPLPAWKTLVTRVTTAEANGSPAKRCPVPAAELRRIWVRYLGFDGRAHTGHITMRRSLVGPVQRAFAKLYRWRFPIMAMPPAVPPDRTVLTLGYECRFVAGTRTWSQHSYGLAVDINPRQNPMIRGDYLDPPNSRPWLARTHHWAGMMHADGAVPAFTSEGFSWGGRWKTLKDYMHFSTTDR
ncbi:M15 family metallopeptidase [Actinoplanes utahensis]|uniref:M15 family metallopeptidase n=1 Tax=Actinoplanes utahensis TaxID=1869 RepID=UPI0009FDD52D|nr:M15 family metallopeptidase [Actinoplanes utahensis]